MKGPTEDAESAGNSRHEPERALCFEPGLTRQAYSDAGAGLVEAARLVPADRWDAPGLGEWTVRDLVGHAGRAFVTVSQYLAAGAGLTPELTHSLDYARAYRAAYADPAAITERGRQAGRDLGDDPVTQLASWRQAANAEVAAHPDAAPVRTPVGVMTLADYLPSRILELVVHVDDLIRALDLSTAVPVDARLIAICYAAGLAVEAGNDDRLLRSMTGRSPLEAGFTVL